MESFFPEVEISAEQAEVMARGLFAVARAEGGIHEREKTLLMSFYSDVAENEGARSLSALESAPDVSPDEIGNALTSKSHGLMFLKTCILMAYADNHFGEKERDMIKAFAKALEVSDEELEDLERAVRSYLLSSLVKLSNSEAVAEVAKEMGSGSKE